MYIIANTSKIECFRKIYANVPFHGKEIIISLTDCFSEYEQMTDKCQCCSNSLHRHLTDNYARKLTKKIKSFLPLFFTVSQIFNVY